MKNNTVKYAYFALKDEVDTPSDRQIFVYFHSVLDDIVNMKLHNANAIIGLNSTVTPYNFINRNDSFTGSVSNGIT